MLELRPVCENCRRTLPPDSLDARICSFECTFCATCVVEVLENVCPNCGGGFCPRPIRPAREWRPRTFLGSHPASQELRHRPVRVNEHADFARTLRSIPPEAR